VAGREDLAEEAVLAVLAFEVCATGVEAGAEKELRVASLLIEVDDGTTDCFVSCFFAGVVVGASAMLALDADDEMEARVLGDGRGGGGGGMGNCLMGVSTESK